MSDSYKIIDHEFNAEADRGVCSQGLKSLGFLCILFVCVFSFFFSNLSYASETEYDGTSLVSLKEVKPLQTAKEAADKSVTTCASQKDLKQKYNEIPEDWVLFKASVNQSQEVIRRELPESKVCVNGKVVDVQEGFSYGSASSIAKGMDFEKLLDMPFDKKAMYGTFHGFVSSLFAFQSQLQVVAVSEKLNNREVHNIYPDFYSPTVKEVLDMVAWQIGATWDFDEADRVVKFYDASAREDTPYSIDMKKGWRKQYRGLYLWYAPDNRDFGMDIYYLGHYTLPSGKEKNVFENEIRKHIATLIMRVYGAPKIPSTEMEMIEASVAAYKALYWEPKLPYEGMKADAPWRQWAFVADGHAFLVVSTMAMEDKETVFSEVDAMLNTFQINKKFSEKKRD